jgi:hypothetical protein
MREPGSPRPTLPKSTSPEDSAHSADLAPAADRPKRPLEPRPIALPPAATGGGFLVAKAVLITLGLGLNLFLAIAISGALR